MSKLKQLLIALTPMGAAAFIGGGGTFSSCAELFDWSLAGRRFTPPPRPVAPTGGMTRVVKTKKLLLAVLAIGAAAYLGGGGTFASFSAEASNNGSSVSSGTLTMSNKVNSATACMSTDVNSTQNNVNPNCNALFALTNVAPGIAAGSAKLTIQNTGSIDASKLFSVAASYVNA